MKKYEPRVIICPQCLHKVGTYGGRSTVNHICRCRNCNKRIVYHVDSGKAEVKEIPKRTCSSGMTFL